MENHDRQRPEWSQHIEEEELEAHIHAQVCAVH